MFSSLWIRRRNLRRALCLVAPHGIAAKDGARWRWLRGWWAGRYVRERLERGEVVVGWRGVKRYFGGPGEIRVVDRAVRLLHSARIICDCLRPQSYGEDLYLGLEYIIETLP